MLKEYGAQRLNWQHHINQSHNANAVLCDGSQKEWKQENENSFSYPLCVGLVEKKLRSFYNDWVEIL